MDHLQKPSYSMDRSKGESSVCDIAAVEWRELRSTMGKLSVPKKIKEKLFGQAYVEWEWLIERRDIDGLDGVFLSDDDLQLLELIC